MKSRTVRVLMVAMVVVALAAAGYFAWQLDQRMSTARAAITAFDNQIRQTLQALASIGTAQRGYVAEGQNSERWQTQVTTMLTGVSPRLTELRLAAKTPEGQGALESAIETMAAFGQADVKARQYVNSGQRLSASDVIFADGSDLLTKAVGALDDAWSRENIQHETAMAKLRQTQLMFVVGAVGLALVVLSLLVPVPRASTGAGDDLDEAVGGGGLGLSQPAGKSARSLIVGGAFDEVSTLTGLEHRTSEVETRLLELGVAAEICSALARVRNPKELPALLARTAEVLDATGVIVWMSEGSPVMLRPVLAHGYEPTLLARLGSIAPDADNATAVAYRTQETQSMSADPPSGGALVVPLITADGCTGAMAVELKTGVEPNDYLRAVAMMLTAQLATLISPAPVADAPRTSPRE